MAKSSKVQPQSHQGVTTQRAIRLCKLLQWLGKGPQTRQTIMQRLHLDVRGFYRDLELLRDSGITIDLEGRRYRLLEKTATAIARLPFPDPRLTLGEAIQLARGRSQAHRKLQRQIADILP